MDFERNFDVSSPTEENPAHLHGGYGEEEEEYECDSEEDSPPPLDPDAPLLPGLYKALYAFEPEGTAEMALEEDQVVRVVGRGGGVGWAVVCKEGGGHALVPESYLELVQVLQEDEDGEVVEDDDEDDEEVDEKVETVDA